MPYLPARDERTTHFRCPECGDDTLEEVSKAMSYTMIAGFYDGHEDYWEREVEDLEVLRIQCYNCGFEVHRGYPQNLHAFLSRKGWLQGPRGREVPSSGTEDWSV